MNVAFDASDLCTGRADGTTRYTSELVTRLPRIAQDIDWNFYGPCTAPNTPSVKNWHPSPFPAAWTQLRLPIELLRDKPDILFMPIQQLPIIRHWKTKTIAVIHDLAFHEYPEQFRYKDWLLLHTFSAQVAKEADAIIAVSEATKKDIEKYYGRKDSVYVVHHGIDHDRFKAFSEEERSAGLLRLQAAYPSLQRPYLLYVGQIQPRKNIGSLIAAFEQLNREDIQLVIAGGHGWHQDETLRRISSSPRKESIIMTGAVPDDLLPALYANSEAFILPSLQEGFGIPLIEAAACGAPLVTSNRSSMKEIAEEAAILINPEDVSSLMQGIAEALTNKTSLSAKSIQLAKRFSWDTTAKETLHIIKNVSAL